MLSFTPTQSNRGSNSTPEEEQVQLQLPTVYKHSISLFRSLYTLLHILLQDLSKRLRRSTQSPKLTMKVLVSSINSLLPATLPFSGSANSTSAHRFLARLLTLRRMNCHYFRGSASWLNLLGVFIFSLRRESLAVSIFPFISFDGVCPPASHPLNPFVTHSIE